MFLIFFVLFGIIIFLFFLYIKALNEISILKHDRNVLTSLFQKLPFGMMVFDNKFNITLLNPYLKNIFNKNKQKDIHEFFQIKEIKEAFLSNAENIKLTLNKENFHGILFSQQLRYKLHYFVFLISMDSDPNPVILYPPVSQLQTLRDMALGLAHELKNPITSLKMLLEIYGTKSRESVNEQFKEILSFELERLDIIIGDFLHFADIGDLKLENNNINDVIDESLNIIFENYKHIKYTIIKNYHPLPKIKIDKKKMIQVFLNLIINSLEALHEYGGKIEINTKKNTDYIECEIIDDGKGISEEDQAKIFLPFFTTKKDGVGLGLSITQKIIQQHNGEIFFSSKFGNKTFFKLILPFEKN